MINTMKSRILPTLILLLITGLASVFAQGSFRSRCPYDVNNWPYPSSDDWLGCPPATFTNPNGPLCPINYTHKPHQDCCGALPLCSLVNDVASVGYGPTTGFNAAICGQGCSQFDLPPVGTTCFGVNERQTSWYVFEIRPLPGQPYIVGAPAGKLRLKIFPCDVPPNPADCDQTTASPPCNCDTIDPTNPRFCNDFGADNIGSVDYDWIVFRINDFRTRRAACNSIASNNSTVVCCNWSAARGPTGIFELPDGTTPSCDQGAQGGRYGAPFPVFVGERYILAVDGFTNNNLKGYKVDFRGRCANELRDGITADVSPVPSAYKLDTALLQDSNYCASGGVVVRFTSPTRNDQIGTNDFKVFQLDADTPDGVDSTSFAVNEVLPVDDPISAALWRINFTPGRAGRFAIRYKDTIPDICGDRYIDDTVKFVISPYLVRNFVGNVRCALPNNFDTLSVTLNKRFDFPLEAPASTDTTIGVYDWQVLKLTALGGETNQNDDDWFTIDRPGKISEIPSAPPFGNLSTSSPRFRPSSQLTEWKKVSVIFVADSILENPGTEGIQSRYFRLKHRFPLGVVGNPLSTGCEDQKTYTVRFFPIPNANIVSADTTCYAEGPGGLSIINPATEKRSYTWYSVSSNESPFLGDSVAFGQFLNPVTVPDEFAYYRVRVIDSTYGCDNIIPGFGRPALYIRNAIQVVPAIGEKVLNDGVATFPASIEFSNASKRLIADRLEGLPSDGITYEWTFEDSVRFTTNDFNQTYVREYRTAPPGTDTVRVRACLRAYDQLSAAVNRNTCILDTCIEVILKIPTFPNVITPGDDNPKNDYLQFLAEGGEYELSVFNRWGQIIYENSDYKNDWNANNVPGGMYYYLVTNKKTKGTFKGWVQVLK